MIDMKKKAEDILEDYANFYSRADLEALAKFLEQIKTEAIKEFWERLKLKKAAVDSWVVYVESGDNLVKEMTE